MAESLNAYLAARQNGISAYNRMVALGRPGHLPYLDDLLMDVEIISRDPLGEMDLPMKKVIGTVYRRAQLVVRGELHAAAGARYRIRHKWRTVYGYQAEEGIRDAVKVYEFLNWFYVVEGNKRVSVLKFFDAGSVLADVTRLVPRYDESDENIRLYYEFLDFYRETRINRIWLTKPGGYQALLGLFRGLEVPKAERDNPSKYFLDYCYTPFRNALYEVGGDKLPYTTGDVFLKYFSLYKLHRKMTEKGMKPRLRALCEELRANAGEEAGLVTAPEAAREPSLISSIISIGRPKTPVRIAFAYSGSVGESNWAKAHERGRLHLQEALGGEIQTSCVDNVAEDHRRLHRVQEAHRGRQQHPVRREPCIRKRGAAHGARVPERVDIRLLRAAAFEPRAHVLRAHLRSQVPDGPHRGVAHAHGQDRLRGQLPREGRHQRRERVRAGRAQVNPQAKVVVSWAYQWDFAKVDEDCSARLAELGCDIISHQNTFTGAGYEGEYGLYSMGCEHGCAPDEYIATPVWNWGVFYEMIVRQYLSGAMRNPADARPTQFWWGLSSGIVDVMYAKKIVPLETHKLVGVFKNLMKEGAYNPFTGPVFDRDGVERIPAGVACGRAADHQHGLARGRHRGQHAAIPSGWEDSEMTSELLEL